MSQRELVLARLRRGPLCQTAIYREPGITHRLAARIYDLRQQGYDIDSRPCQDPSHRHDSPVVEYVLNEGGQGSLL